MKSSKILKKQEQLLKEVDFLADKFTQNERKNKKTSAKSNI